jgi:hypothetical protein
MSKVAAVRTARMGFRLSFMGGVLSDGWVRLSLGGSGIVFDSTLESPIMDKAQLTLI